ncbi:5102_t:CDS:2 [Ambispora leptoticha]|uniref:CXXC-type zinc finger protein 1 n=1 Tax=Ambispora leptoticha TaxID=144679 RepID=A0A9N8WAN9_9GLOM|nr:5102_t:CDS:2 [Ambispora leptoticha]
MAMNYGFNSLSFQQKATIMTHSNHHGNSNGSHDSTNNSPRQAIISPNLHEQHHQKLQPPPQRIASPQTKSFNISSMLNPAPSPPHRPSPQQQNNSSTGSSPPTLQLTPIASSQYFTVSREVGSNNHYQSRRISQTPTTQLSSPPPHFLPSYSAFHGIPNYSSSLTITNTTSTSTPPPNSSYLNNTTIGSTNGSNNGNNLNKSNSSNNYHHSHQPINFPAVHFNSSSNSPNSQISSSKSSSPVTATTHFSAITRNSVSTLPEFTPLRQTSNHIINKIDINSGFRIEEKLVKNQELIVQPVHLSQQPPQLNPHSLSYSQQSLSSPPPSSSIINQSVVANNDNINILAIAATVVQNKSSQEFQIQQRQNDKDDVNVSLSSSKIDKKQQQEDDSSNAVISPSKKTESLYSNDSYNNSNNNNRDIMVPPSTTESYELISHNSPAMSNTSADGVYEYEEPIKGEEEESMVSDIEGEIKVITNETNEDSKSSTTTSDNYQINNRLDSYITKESINNQEESSSGEKEYTRRPQKAESSRRKKNKLATQKKPAKKTNARVSSNKKGIKRRSSESVVADSGDDDYSPKSDMSHPNSNNTINKKPAKRQKKQSRSTSAHVSKINSPNLLLTNKGSTAEEIGLDDLVQPDNKLYCICRTLYDGLRFMICCDNCSEWYHGDCVKISEEESLLIDKYYCPSCTAKGHKSQWIPRCKNTPCNKPARVPESKYCSRECGLAWARARLAESEEKRAKLLLYLKANEKKTKNSPKNTSNNNNIANSGVKSKKYTRNLAAEREDFAQLKRIHDELEKIKRSLQVNRKKEKILDKVKSRWEISCEGITVEKQQQCGFDKYLVWGDDLPDDEDRMCEAPPEDNGNVCLELKTACYKHRGWQKTKTMEVEQEKILQTNQLNKLVAEEKQIRLRIKRRRTDLASALMNGTIEHTKHKNAADSKTTVNKS